MTSPRPPSPGPASPWPRRRLGGLSPRQLGRVLLTALLGAALGLLWPQNLRLWDALSRALPSPADDRVVVVGIDEASLRDYGRLGNWPRALYRQALGTLDQAGVRAIGVDVLLSDPAEGDAALAGVFSRPNVVLATAAEAGPGAHPDWRSPTGISAVNLGRDGVVRFFHTAYPDPQNSDQLRPSFARQLAVAAGVKVPLDTQPRLLRSWAPTPGRLPFVPFRDVVNGNVRYGDLQGRVVLIGVTASGLGGATLRDMSGQTVAAVQLQARAVASLLRPDYATLPPTLLALLGALLALAGLWARELWGFGLALLVLALSAPLWLANVLLPGVTLSLATLLGTAVVAAERWRGLRGVATRDPLTGFGNRLAFTRAVESRWPLRQGRPLAVALIDLDGLRAVTERYGHGAREEVLQQISAQLQGFRRRGDLIFRWGPDEFALLLDNPGADALPALSQRLQDTLERVRYRDLTLRASVGAAHTTPQTLSPTDLIEEASRSRYRVKYQREQRG